MKKDKPNPKANRGILGFSYVVALLFAAMAVYMGYFLQVKSEEVVNNPYNARINERSEQIVRGEIIAADGTILARTATDSNGTETREYPYGELFAHSVGYSTAGKTGVESLANFYLLSSHSSLLEKVTKELADQKMTGDNVVTTLEPSLQQIASDALGDRRGAVVAMEPDTGKILAMVSKPSFDPNTVAADWDSLVNGDSSEARLLNRATQGLYPPGSTFKIITALEYMRENPNTWQDFTFTCSGVTQFDNFTIQCSHRQAHGKQNFVQAFANSCNGAFATIGKSLDLTSLRNLSEQLLYNRDQPLSLPYSKSAYQMTEGAPEWEICQTAIGQGSTLMTPMHNLMLVSAIANGGTLMTPYLIDRVESADGELIQKFLPQASGEIMVANEAAALTELMTHVVTEGTGSALRTDAYQAAGKTGSAEFDSGKDTHAWFVGFAPVENPKIAVCVIVEEGGSGGRTAAPIARKLFDAYLDAE